MAEKTKAAEPSLWEERAADWAEVMEGWNGWGVPVYRHVLERVSVGPDTELLEVGCGAGRFSRIAADRGARCTGIDATAAFIEIARSRVPDGDFRVGDMEELPFPDDSFDVVTGFNSFFIGDMVTALREARRVARPGSSVAMTVFGRPENCQSTAVFASIGPLMAAAGSGGGGADDEAPTSRPLYEEGTIEAIATEAGLEPVEAGYLAFAENYPDLATMLCGYMAAPPFVRAARAAGTDAVRAALTEAFAPLRAPEGGYRLHDEIRYLVATA